MLFHHDTLPLGEFAIGTNTTAYRMMKTYQIGAKMPILIAEKTVPHFAVGDTCYSWEEDVKVYNPDGKEIVARENEISACRKEDPGKAYFNCHTDITIPYEELGELYGVRADGSKIVDHQQWKVRSSGDGGAEPGAGEIINHKPQEKRRIAMAKVGIVMGSDSDMPIMAKAADILEELGIDYEMTIISAHREPDIFFDVGKDRRGEGL